MVIFKKKRPKRQIPEIAAPRLPEDERVVAIGDIHGRSDLLVILLDGIAEYEAEFPVRHTTEIFLGDYVDRGQNSAEVIDILMAQGTDHHRRICLTGNHEHLLLLACYDVEVLRFWLQHCGAQSTLRSFGLTPPPANATHDALSETCFDLERMLGPDRLAFLASLPYQHEKHGHIFVHAGLRPNVPVEQQTDDDRIHIRGDFLKQDYDFGAVVVHGHTPRKHIDIRPFRINVDTGAFATNRLSCLVIENGAYRLIQAGPDGYEILNLDTLPA
ncbi:MAG: metallophosphoesterase [Stappiaceae bacterium]